MCNYNVFINFFLGQFYAGGTLFDGIRIIPNSAVQPVRVSRRNNIAIFYVRRFRGFRIVYIYVSIFRLLVESHATRGFLAGSNRTRAEGCANPPQIHKYNKKY